MEKVIEKGMTLIMPMLSVVSVTLAIALLLSIAGGGDNKEGNGFIKIAIFVIAVILLYLLVFRRDLLGF